MAKSPLIKIEFTLDIEGVRVAFGQLEIAFRRAAKELRGFVNKFIYELDPKYVYGKNNFRDDGTWVSDMCSAWLHESCELPDECACNARACPHRKR